MERRHARARVCNFHDQPSRAGQPRDEVDGPRFSSQLARSTPPFNNGVYKLRSEALADFLDEWEAKQDLSPLMSWPRLPRSFASRRQRTISRRRERTRCRRCGAPPRRSRRPLLSATRRHRTAQELTAMPAQGISRTPGLT
jgi:hypothetical protein